MHTGITKDGPMPLLADESWDGFVMMSNYAASKAGVLGMSKSLAREDAGAHPAPAVRAPRGRRGMVSYLLSVRAAYITGQMIRVDGGAAL